MPWLQGKRDTILKNNRLLGLALGIIAILLYVLITLRWTAGA